jgi:hypothetical protein
MRKSGNFGMSISVASVRQIRGSTVFCDIYREDYYPEEYSGIQNKVGSEYLKTVVILNYPKPETLTTGGGCNCRCISTTNYVSGNGVSYKAYDCGTEATGDEIQKWRADEAERQEAAAKALAEQRRAAAERTAAGKKASDEKVLKWHLEQAEKGDSFGLLRMGEHYRDGDGVPQDLNKAREYFSRALAAGSPSAADALSKLDQAPTNPPVRK